MNENYTSRECIRKKRVTSRDTEQFSLTLEPVANDSRPGAIRLRGALKELLRGWGLRCVTVQRVAETDVTSTTDTIEQRKAGETP